MRRSIISVTILAALALPGSAFAANSITVHKVVAPDSTAIADASGTVDVPCSDAECRWTVSVVLGDTVADCATSNRIVFASDLQPPGSGTLPFSLRYATPAGPRPEFACLRVFDTERQGSVVVFSFEYPVPAVGGTFPASAPAPASSGVAGASASSQALASGFRLTDAGAALHRSLKRRYGRRWNVAGSRSVDCVPVSSRSYSCTIRFDGRTLRARVTLLSGGGRIGIKYL